MDIGAVNRGNLGDNVTRLMELEVKCKEVGDIAEWAEWAFLPGEVSNARIEVVALRKQISRIKEEISKE